MKIRSNFLFVLLLTCLIGANQVNAQLVEKSTITAEQADIQLIAPNTYMLEIGGANNYYWKEEVAHTDQISISTLKADGKAFADGTYTLQITPIVKLSDEERIELRALLSANDVEKITAFRQAHNLPERVEVSNIYFSIRNGKFVTPDQKEAKINLPAMVDVWQQDHPAMYASIDYKNINYAKPMKATGITPAMDNTMDDAQVFTQDVIVQGSLCVGIDCATTESFSFDTQRFKENNLRIHFNDTSNSASFPGNDWRITINDSSNGGANYFAIEDATAGRVPFRIESSAPQNALYVDNNGDIGVGTSTPVLELHVTDGDSPALRLEQDGSSGFGSQIWDMAGNETNFFIRDVTNGSSLPFRIRPGASQNSIYIDSDSDIGLGTDSPSERLQVETGNIYVKAGNVGINVVPDQALDVVGASELMGNVGIGTTPTSNFDLDVLGSTRFRGDVVFRQGDPSFFMDQGTNFLNASFESVLRIDATTRRVGIKVDAVPSHELEVCGTIATTEMAVTTNITCSSDIRYKKNVTALEGSLDKLMQLRGVTYNWKTEEFPKKNFNEDKQIGFIAQEVQALFPDLVKEQVDGYLSVDYVKMTPILVEAVKEQQEMIDAQKTEIAALQAELNELKDLKAQVAALSNMVSTLTEVEQNDAANEAEVTGEKE